MWIIYERKEGASLEGSSHQEENHAFFNIYA